MCGLYWSYKWFPVVTAIYIPILCGVVMSVTNFKIVRAVWGRHPQAEASTSSEVVPKIEKKLNETVVVIDSVERCPGQSSDDDGCPQAKRGTPNQAGAIPNVVNLDTSGRVSSDHAISTQEPSTEDPPSLVNPQGVSMPELRQDVMKDEVRSMKDEVKVDDRYDMRVFKVLGFTTIFYFLAWTPYITIVLITSFMPDLIQSISMRFIIIWLANSNSFMNVIIYSVTYSSFRANTVNLVKKCFSGRNQAQGGGVA